MLAVSGCIFIRCFFILDAVEIHESPDKMDLVSY
jgi:hypothetical protein